MFTAPDFYNVRIKKYPNGKQQYLYSERLKKYNYTETEEKKKTGENKERKKEENKKRALQKVYDLAHSNIWKYFITLTFDPNKVDSFNYDECTKHMKLFTQRLRDREVRYLIVAEKHDSGRYHFHGLIDSSVPMTTATNAHTGEALIDREGRAIYNLSIYGCGFTTATEITDSSKASSYLAKYISKDLSVPHGKKCYWASRKLLLPAEEYVNMTSMEFGEIFNNARYTKTMDTPYGMYLLAEN